MDTKHFDSLTRSISGLLSRRALTATLGVAALGLTDLADAKKRKRRRKKRKKKKKVILNEFGCVNVGNFCQNDDQCCSNICGGSKCQAHDADVCQGGDEDTFCGGTDADCLAANGNDGFCNSTTGNTGYCVGDRKCLACTKDADCTQECGLDAACIVCTSCVDTGGAACAGATCL